MTQLPPTSKKLLWTGRVLSALIVAFMLMGASMALSESRLAVDGMVKYGFPPGIMRPLGAVELLCALLYAIPQTSVLGAILLTGYLGGATATHVRAGEPFIMPVVVGILVWVALYLRDPRIRALIPLRA